MSWIVLDCHEKERQRENVWGKKEGEKVWHCPWSIEQAVRVRRVTKGCTLGRQRPFATRHVFACVSSIFWVSLIGVCLTSRKLMSGMTLKYTSSWMVTKDVILFQAYVPAQVYAWEHTHHRNPSIIASKHNGREWVERVESWESAASGWANYPTGRCFFLVRLPFSATPPCVMWRSGQGTRKMKGTLGNPQAYFIRGHISDILLLNPSGNISHNLASVYFSEWSCQLKQTQYMHIKRESIEE